MSERQLVALALHAPDAREQVERVAQLLRKHGTAVVRLRPTRKSARSAEEQVVAQLDDADVVLLFVAKSRHASSEDLGFLLDDLPIDFGVVLRNASHKTMLVLLEELRVPESLASMPVYSLAGMDGASLDSAVPLLADAIREHAERAQAGSAADGDSESPTESGETGNGQTAADSDAPESVTEPDTESVVEPESATDSTRPDPGADTEAATGTGRDETEEEDEEIGGRRPLPLGTIGATLAVVAVIVGLYLHREVPLAGDDGLYPDADGSPYALIVPEPFQMGSDGAPGRLDERPAHFVSMNTPFLIAVHEVTNTQYNAYVEATGARTGPPPSFVDAARDGWPVVNVTFEDARDYADWQSTRQEATFRLPTEAEWEYVAGRASALLEDPCTYVNFRGGETSASLSPSSNLLAPAAADEPYCSYESPTLVEVSELAADSLGLRHLYGNAAEWVADCYASNYLAAPTDGSAKTSGDCSYRVFRGGSWITPAAWLSPTVRARAAPDYRDFHLGFRLVRELDPLDAWALARPGRDWNSLLPIAAWACYGLAFLFLLLWLREIPRESPGAMSAIWRVPPTSGEPAEDTREPDAPVHGEHADTEPTPNPEIDSKGSS